MKKAFDIASYETVQSIVESLLPDHMVEKHNRGLLKLRRNSKDTIRKLFPETDADTWPLYFVRSELNEIRLLFLLDLIDDWLELVRTSHQPSKEKVGPGPVKLRHVAGTVCHDSQLPAPKEAWTCCLCSTPHKGGGIESHPVYFGNICTVFTRYTTIKKVHFLSDEGRCHVCSSKFDETGHSRIGKCPHVERLRCKTCIHNGDPVNALTHNTEIHQEPGHNNIVRTKAVPCRMVPVSPRDEPPSYAQYVAHQASLQQEMCQSSTAPPQHSGSLPSQPSSQLPPSHDPATSTPRAWPGIVTPQPQQACVASQSSLEVEAVQGRAEVGDNAPHTVTIPHNAQVFTASPDSVPGQDAEGASRKTTAPVHLSLRNLNCLKPFDPLSAVFLAFKNKCSFENTNNIISPSSDALSIQRHQNFLSIKVAAGTAEPVESQDSNVEEELPETIKNIKVT